MDGLYLTHTKTICKCMTEKLGHVAHDSITILQSTCSCVNDKDVTVMMQYVIKTGAVHAVDCWKDMLSLIHLTHGLEGLLIILLLQIVVCYAETNRLQKLSRHDPSAEFLTTSWRRLKRTLQCSALTSKQLTEANELGSVSSSTKHILTPR